MASTYTLLASQIDLNTFIKTYHSYEQLPTNKSIQYLFIKPNCRITCYHSGKILFQGTAAEQEYSRWQPHLVVKNNNIIVPTSRITTNYIGCDETGVGDYFAPLVTAACYINDEMTNQLQTLNIKDSKQLTDTYIQTIAPKIKAIIPHTIFVLSNEQYNSFVENHYNAHAIKAFVHNKTIGKLITRAKLSPTVDIVMDQFASPQNYRKYLKNITPIYVPTIFETKAENKYLGVACASILARDMFLTVMTEKQKIYAMDFPLGAGKKVDAFGKDFIKKFGEEAFKQNVKWHFANTQKILEDI